MLGKRPTHYILQTTLYIVHLTVYIFTENTESYFLHLTFCKLAYMFDSTASVELKSSGYQIKARYSAK